VTLSSHDRPARTRVAAQAAALAVAAAGIIVQIIAGVNYPAVPPGLIILLVAAALVLFLPWRWVSLIAVFASGFLLIGGFANADSRSHLTHVGHAPGAFAGTLLQMVAMAAVVAGVLALAAQSRRPAAAVAE
jgi:hypothetical protein